MARPVIPRRSTKRKSSKKKPKIILHIVCEGQNTEPDYLRLFCDFYKKNNMSVSFTKGKNAAKTVVKEAKKKYDALKKRSEETGFENRFEVWAVFDIDENKNVRETKKDAEKYGIKVAISNPCIEIWPVLHLEDFSKEISRKNIQIRLEKLMPKYDRDGSKKIDFCSIHGKYEIAKRRAILLSESHEAQGRDIIDANPSTDIYHLLERIKN